jgi:heat-inducible transcriptional repressor
MVTETELSERAQLLLKALVEQYVADGRPVGSRTLSRDAGLKLSPATVRNVMADLEDMGLVVSPHTSAGRVPTVQGYRVFVDSLLTLQPLAESTIEQLRNELGIVNTTQDLISRASDTLSEVTNMAGVVMLPKLLFTSFQQIEFLPLSDNRILAITVHNDKEVQNRVIHTQREYSAAELQQAANYLSEQFRGQNLQSARRKLLEEMQQARDSMNRMMQAAIEMAEKVMDDEPDKGPDYVVAGQTNLMGFEELSDVEKLRRLFEAFTQKQDMLHLLDQAMNAQGIQIFIGNESGYEAFDDCSVIATPYKVDNEVAGVLGVVGPTRMAYDRVIPIVDITARLLGAALNPK